MREKYCPASLMVNRITTMCELKWGHAGPHKTHTITKDGDEIEITWGIGWGSATREEEQSLIDDGSFFACGPDVCSGGTHEWGNELVSVDDHSASVVCKKCGMTKLDRDMWAEP